MLHLQTKHLLMKKNLTVLAARLSQLTITENAPQQGDLISMERRATGKTGHDGTVVSDHGHDGTVVSDHGHDGTV
jgi:hypothetical protein